MLMMELSVEQCYAERLSTSRLEDRPWYGGSDVRRAVHALAIEANASVLALTALLDGTLLMCSQVFLVSALLVSTLLAGTLLAGSLLAGVATFLGYAFLTGTLLTGIATLLASALLASALLAGIATFLAGSLLAGIATLLAGVTLLGSTAARSSSKKLKCVC
jgi:hypothetical protein